MAWLTCIFVVIAAATQVQSLGRSDPFANPVRAHGEEDEEESALLQTANQLTRLAGLQVHKLTPHEASNTRVLLKTEKLETSIVTSQPTLWETAVISSSSLTVILVVGVISAVLVGIGAVLQDFSIQDYSEDKKTGGPYDATPGTYITAYVLALASLVMAIMAPEVKSSLPGEVHTNIIAAYFIGFLCWTSTGLMHQIWTTDGRGHNILSTCAIVFGGWSAMSRAEAAMKVAVLSGNCHSCPDAETIDTIGGAISVGYLIIVLLAVFQYIPVPDVRLRRIMEVLMDVTLFVAGCMAGQKLWASHVLAMLLGVLVLAHVKISPFIYSETFNETGLLHCMHMQFLASTFGLLCAMTKIIS